jgi:hypothetical protein
VQAGRTPPEVALSAREREARGDRGEPAVEGPERRAAEGGGCEEVDVDPTDAACMKSVTFDESQHLLVRGGPGLRQIRETPEDLGAPPEVAERHFPENGGVAKDLSVEKKRRELLVSPPEVIDPDGRVDEDQRPAPRLRAGAGRRRRGGRSVFSEPPSAASRRALSRAISASSPAWTIAVFSLRPVRFRAFSRRVSFRIRVVLICISMPS